MRTQIGKKLSILAMAVIGLSIAPAIVWGQSTTAQIGGTVKDASGLAVPEAEVKATQSATGAVRTVNTGADGGYVLTNLPIGPYVLEISKEGFSKYVQSGIVLQVDANRTVDAALKIGSVSEQVTVQADAAMVETRSTSVGTVVDNQHVVELPLNGRNATELIFLAGMATVANDGLASVRNYPTVMISVAGGIANWTTYVLDGANNNDPYNNLNYPTPFPDALQEFKVETSALQAQYGQHASAAVNIVTKSGTNQLHGDAFDFIRNGDFNARDFFAPTRDTIKRNQFGGTIGGPVLPRFKDKLFFFAGYQGTIQKSAPGQNTAYVPTPAELAGNFTTVASPACNNGKQLQLAASQGFVGNQISPSLLNASALKLSAKLPTATTTPCGQVQFGILNNNTENLIVGRIDYQRSDKHSMFGRFYLANYDTPTTFDGQNLLTVNTVANWDRVYSLALGDTYLLSSNVVSSFRLGATRAALPKGVDNAGGWQAYGINAVSLAPPTIMMSFTGNGFAIGGGNAIPTLSNTGPNPSIGEDISWVRGAHQFGFGGNSLFTQIVFRGYTNATGKFTFNGSVTGLSMADFMVGQAATWVQGNPNPFYNHQNYVGLYAQDTWKVTPRLTINYGLRWEPYLAIVSKYGWVEHFDQGLFASNTRSSVYPNAPAGLTFPGDSQFQVGNSFTNNRLLEFLPRAGLSWDPTGSGRMTVRAAFGMFTDKAAFNSTSATSQSPPFGDNLSLNNVNLSNPWASYPGGNPFPIPLNKNIQFPLAGGFISQTFSWKPTEVNEWNLSVQRQLGANWLVTGSYIGNNMFHLQVGNEVNPAVFLGLGACTIQGPNGPQTYPVCSTTGNTNQRRQLYLQNPTQGQYYSILEDTSDGGTGSYNAAFFAVQKRLSGGTTILANYTYSHCISDYWLYNPGQSASSNVTPGNRRNDRSNCQQNGITSDQRQLFNLSLVYQTPKFANRALRMLASDWQISPIMKIKSGQIFTVTSGVDAALNGEGLQRPNLVGNPYPANQSVTNWLTPSAFALPAPGTVGNLGNNNILGPGIFQFDMAVSRMFPIREKQTIQLRAEAFNLPNHMNPGIPVTTTNSGAFGQIQSDISGTSGLTAGDPRIIQFALKFVF